MKTVAVTKQIPVSADAAWAIVSTGDKMDRWSPPVTACSLEGSGPGARRVCVINDKQLDEVIETVDDRSRVFQYRIVRQELMPVTNVLGTIHIAPISEHACQVLWLTNFDLLDEAVGSKSRKAWKASTRSASTVWPQRPLETDFDTHSVVQAAIATRGRRLFPVGYSLAMALRDQFVARTGAAGEDKLGMAHR